MRRIPSLLALFLLLGAALPIEAQVQRPQFRPAVLGSGPDSLINRIDAKALLEKGQKDGAVMFCAMVDKNGAALQAWTYRPMPGTEALVEEVTKKLEGVKFTAPIYNYQPVPVLLYGTVIFSTTDAAKVRILLNQDPNEIKEAADLIAPQPVFGADSKFDGLTPPPGGAPIPLTAVVDLRMKVSREGHLQDLAVLAEEAPGLGFAEAAVADFRDAKFIPAFRNGDPTDSDIVMPVCYKPSE